MDKIRERNVLLSIIIILIIAITALILCMMTLSSSKLSVKDKTEKELSASYIASSVVTKMNYQNLSEITADNISKYYEIPDGVIEDASMYISSRPESCTEVACFKLTDENKEDELMKSISVYLNSKLNTYKNVSDKEYKNINNSKTKEHYPYVIVVIASDSDAAISAFDSIVTSNS